jgi:hypothetical protein
MCAIRRKDACHRRRPLHRIRSVMVHPPGRGTIPSEGIQGDEWGA